MGLDYNQERPHRSLGDLTPEAHAEKALADTEEEEQDPERGETST
jgi:transposase InsO family protein